MLFTRLMALLQRPDLVGLPAVIFCEPHMRSHWLSKEKLLARYGYRAEQETTFPGALGELLHLIVYRWSPKPGRAASKPSLRSLLRDPATYLTGDGEMTVGLINTLAGWSQLQPVWNELLERTPSGTVFQTYEYLQCWWHHIGALDDLRLFVCLRGDEVVGIAPMYTATVFWLGRPLRCLLFIGQPSESDRPTLLADATQAGIASAVADYIIDNPGLWDRIIMFEQPETSPFFQSIRRRMEADGMLMTVLAVPPCPYTEIEGSWKSYFAGRSKSFRKNVSRRTTQLERAGEVRYESQLQLPGESADALSEFVNVERNSWKQGQGLGASKSSSHLAFYRELATVLGSEASVEFKFLRLDGRPVAATFGIVWRGCFYSLHITHDSSFNDYSPGLVLTAKELEEAFEQQKYRVFDFLGGYTTNKMSWATGSVETVGLFAHRRGLRNWLFHFISFSVRPRLRAWLVQRNLLRPELALRLRAEQFARKWMAGR
jgi:CelD/BcsL family acetyltransferase involved in cellulose biosynthesis